MNHSATRRKVLANVACMAVASLLSVGPSTVMAQGYPDRPLRIVVPFSTGGAFDTVARAVAPVLAERLGQPVVIENRTGAGGTIAAQAVAKMPADGYTLLMGDIGTHGIAPYLYPNLGYDPIKDFTPISLSVTVPLVMVVNPDVPARDLSSYVAWVKRQGQAATYASGGSGGISHLAVEMFKSMGDVKMLHVPYKGSSPALVDVMGGQVQMMMPSAASSLPHIRAGKLRALAVTGARRLASMPDLPAIGEVLPGYAVEPWVGMLVAAGTPPAVVEKLRREFAAALDTPAVRERLVGLGFEVVAGSGDQLAKVIAADVARWGSIVAQSGAKAD